jgi:prophage DNA circulation protein
MTLLERLYTASFRGVEFYVTDASTRGGRKLVTHEFPNTDRRYVEDLGRLQKEFTVSAIISGNNYIQDRNSLIEALETPGRGLLVHPFYGNLQVVPRPYTLIEDTRELGRARFDITFQRSEENIFPEANFSNLSNISRQADNSLDRSVQDIIDNFNVDPNFPDNFTDAQNTIDRIVGSFESNSRTSIRNRDNLNQFDAELKDAERDKNQAIDNPEQLSEQIKQLIELLERVLEGSDRKIRVYSRFYDIGDNRARLEQNTQQRIERQINRDTLNKAIQAAALIQSYRNAVMIEYGNIRELNENRNLLEDQYKKVLASDITSNETKREIETLRNEVRKFFEEEELNVNRIDEINVNTQPLTLLTYSYYGSTANVERLADLNDINDNAFIEGLIEILTDGS